MSHVPHMNLRRFTHQYKRVTHTHVNTPVETCVVGVHPFAWRPSAQHVQVALSPFIFDPLISTPVCYKYV